VTCSRRLFWVLVFLASACFALPSAQVVTAELKSEPDPVKRAEKALTLADSFFDNARAFYKNDEIQKGDAQLEQMTAALDQCVSSLRSAHKNRFYKKAEMHVAHLQRRLQGLMDEIAVTQRGWAEQTQRKLEEIHDKLLEGAMQK